MLFTLLGVQLTPVPLAAQHMLWVKLLGLLVVWVVTSLSMPEQVQRHTAVFRLALR
jgi:hypothetical protein